MPSIELNHATLHYILRDNNSFTNLVLVHGSGGSHESWPQEVLELDSANVYLLDLPGHGRSTGDNPGTVEGHAAVADAFCRKLGLDNVVLGGHSMGGAIALHCSLERFTWLSRLVLVGTGCRLRVNPAVFKVLETSGEEGLAMVGKMVFRPGASPEVVEREVLRLQEVPASLLVEDFRACDRFDVCSRLGEIDYPALVVVGEEDTMTPVKYSQYLSEGIKDSQLQVIPGAGHMVALEQGGELCRVLEVFLSQDPAC